MWLTVDPVFLIPHSRNHTRPKGARRIQAAASVVHADHFSHEQREPDADRSHESGFVLLVGQHVDGEDQLAGKNGFDLKSEISDLERSRDIERGF